MRHRLPDNPGGIGPCELRQRMDSINSLTRLEDEVMQFATNQLVERLHRYALRKPVDHRSRRSSTCRIALLERLNEHRIRRRTNCLSRIDKGAEGFPNRQVYRLLRPSEVRVAAVNPVP